SEGERYSERKRGRERESEGERDSERKRGRERGSEGERDSERKKGRERESEGERGSERKREKERENEGERDSERKRGRERKSEWDGERERERRRERERERERRRSSSRARDGEETENGPNADVAARHGPTSGLTERREPESRPASPVRPVRAGRVSRPRPSPVPGTHSMTLRPSTAPQRVPLPSPPASSLPAGPDPASDSLRAASPAVTRFLATAVTDPLFESTAASALVVELVDFAAACRLDYAARLVTESASVSVCPPSIGGECALGTDVLEDRQEEFECFAASVPHLVSMLLAPEGDPDAPDIPTPRSYAEAIEGPYSSRWQAAMDAEMASWKSKRTYINEVPPPGVNIVSGMWIFRVKRPPGSPPAFKARYVARGFTQPFYRAACTRRSGCAAHLASLGRFQLVPSGASDGHIV
ncbi:unnamed protein product, partial [Closterium sp. NIES-54]